MELVTSLYIYFKVVGPNLFLLYALSLLNHEPMRLLSEATIDSRSNESTDTFS
jgi:hypothetical protein